MQRNLLDHADPEWAWSPYEPTTERPWDRQQAAHLHRRAGFGVTSAELDEAVRRGHAAAVQTLFEEDAAGAAFSESARQLVRFGLAAGSVDTLAAAWLYRLLAGPRPLTEKMMLFWHGHFATSAEKVKDAHIMQGQNDLLRRHALGDFAELVQGISRDPAMLIYLDSTTNRKSHPNENYARELMELFCLGEGNYTERDVLELARCFTGWEVRRRRFKFNRYRHDFEVKTILGATGPFSGEQAVDVVLRQPSSARFIAGKLVRYLVMDEPAPDEALLEPLARAFREADLHIQPVVERILRSQLFHAATARKIRSPVELIAGVLRPLEGTTDVTHFAPRLRQLGQGLFFPPNVKGWDGGRSWINSSTLIGRANLVREVLVHERTRFAGGSLSDYIAGHGPDTPEAVVDWLAELLLAVPLPTAVREQLVAQSGDGRGDAAYVNVIHTMSTLPEFHLN